MTARAQASGNISTALGDNTTASGTASTAMGYLTKASNFTSTAMGSTTEASGNTSTAMGEGTTANGDYSTAGNGVLYFDTTGKMVGAAGTTAGITTSNFILTTDASGIPKWTTTIDGGQF